MVTWYQIYVTTAFDCPWCAKAKELLDVYGKDYVIYDIHTDDTAKEFFLEEGHTKVPQIYREEVLIGGHDLLKEHLRINHSVKARQEHIIQGDS